MAVPIIPQAPVPGAVGAPDRDRPQRRRDDRGRARVPLAASDEPDDDEPVVRPIAGRLDVVA